MPPQDTRHLGRGEVDCPWLTDDDKVNVTLHLSRLLPGAKFVTSRLAPGHKQMGWTVEVSDDTANLWCANHRSGPKATPAKVKPFWRQSSPGRLLISSAGIASPRTHARGHADLTS